MKNLKNIKGEQKKQSEDLGIFGNGLRSKDGEPAPVEKYPIKNDWHGEFDNAPPCFYNLKVGCKFPYCKNCGWNPAVAVKRIQIKYGDAAVNYLTMNN